MSYPAKTNSARRASPDITITQELTTKVQSKVSTMGREGGSAENKLRGYKAYVNLNDA